LETIYLGWTLQKPSVSGCSHRLFFSSQIFTTPFRADEKRDVGSLRIKKKETNKETPSAVGTTELIF